MVDTSATTRGASNAAFTCDTEKLYISEKAVATMFASADVGKCGRCSIEPCDTHSKF